jgi:hypothetical protein
LIKRALHRYEKDYELAYHRALAKEHEARTEHGEGPQLELARKRAWQKLEGRRESLTAVRANSLQRFHQLMEAEKQAALEKRRVARAARLAIWERYRATGSEREAIAQLRALTQSKKQTKSPFRLEHLLGWANQIINYVKRGSDSNVQR